MLLLEIISTNLTDAKIAAQSGADRLELISGLAEGGLTPSYGLIDEVVHAVDIPVNVIIRPHSRSFCYNEDDVQTMVKDIRVVRQLGAAGIVIGALKENGEIDEETMRRLLDGTDGLDVTVHRAFDYARDQEEALQVLSKFPEVKRVLTSGGRQPAPQAMDKIKQLRKQAQKTSLTIMAGHGLKLETFAKFIKETGIREVHFGSGVREDGNYNRPIDGRMIRQLKNVWNNVSKEAKNDRNTGVGI